MPYAIAMSMWMKANMTSEVAGGSELTCSSVSDAVELAALIDSDAASEYFFTTMACAITGISVIGMMAKTVIVSSHDDSKEM